jgi:tripartite-type tricarboxylate transporter receptor subunit TctC
MSRKPMNRIRTAGVIAASLSLSLGLAACGNPQGVGDDGKTDAGAKVPSRVEMVIPYDEGGGTDTWARFLEPYLKKHVAGGPTFLPENKPGGESITGSNEFVRSGGTDGKQVLVTSATTYFQALLKRPEVEFDFSKMRPLIMNGSGGVIYTSPKTGIKNADDLAKSKKKLKYGGISATGLDMTMLQAMDVLKKPVDATFGFEGRETALLAYQRGEVDIDYQTTSAYKTQVEPLVKKGKAVPLMSFGVLKGDKVVRDPNVPNLPTVEEFHKEMYGKEPSGRAYDSYKAFLLPGTTYQKGLWANEDTPDSIVNAYWDSVDKLKKDKKFESKSGEVLGGYPLYSGENGEKQIQKAFEIDPDARKYALEMLKREYGESLGGT